MSIWQPNNPYTTHPAPSGPTVFDFSPVLSADDGFRRATGPTWDDSATLVDIGESATSALDGAFRFTGMASQIPQGTTITKAELILDVFIVNGSGASFNVYAGDYDAMAVWNPPNSNPMPDGFNFTEVATASAHSITSTGVKTLIITPTIQDIINRATWTELIIGIACQETQAGINNNFRAFAQDFGSREAILRITVP